MGEYFKLKTRYLGDTDKYLGAKLWKMQLDNGMWEW